ncbi:monocarboxylate transporter 9-like [Aricia agestis]|uniref:monocarboxylate transporter 9-like n=1 Tax=Aricia agestis TaxID=91739 RepID=UPI001C20336E|nr:monocarboxylate transporter 9-like [Aricia agestis]
MEPESPRILRNRACEERKKPDAAPTVLESLLSDTTSGIVKGEDDTTSVGTTFSSPEIEVPSNDNIVVGEYKKAEEEDDFDGIKHALRFMPIINKSSEKINVKNVESETLLAKPETKKVTIPDGGWGWVVVLSSFILSMIADGISFSFGLLYIEFLDEFKASKSTTAWIGSLFIAVPLLSGPVMSALVDRYGCRSMTILGGLISTLGFVLASVSNTLETMMITFGVIAGLGLGLVYVTAVVSIAYWFEKKRNLAVGLGACGTGVGTFVYAPMTQYFIDEYGWRGTILLLAGTLLNICVCGCVMRDPEWWILEQKRQRDLNDKSNVKSRSSSIVSLENPYVFDYDSPTRGKSMKRLILKGLSPEKVIRDEVASIRRHENLLLMSKNYKKQRSRSLIDIYVPLVSNNQVIVNIPCSPEEMKATEKMKTLQLPIVNDELRNINADCPKISITRTQSDYCGHRDISNEPLPAPTFKPRRLRKSMSESKDVPLIKQDSKENKRDWLKKQLSVNHHYLRDLKMPLNSISHRNAMLNIKKYKLKASSCPDIFKNSMITFDEEEEKWYDDFVDCLGDMFNVSLLKKATFDLLCLGTIIIFIWFIVPYFYLAEHMVHQGYTEDDGAVMLSLIGITNTIGMVTLGWIGDFPKVSIGTLYSVCLILCGASVAAIPPAASNYWILASISAAFGLLFAASFTFTPSLLVKLVSLDDFTAAYGLVLLAQGIGHLIGPPLSGLIYDLTLSWELSFYLAGGWIMIAGVLIFFIHPIQIYMKRREARSESDDSIA